MERRSGRECHVHETDRLVVAVAYWVLFITTQAGLAHSYGRKPKLLTLPDPVMKEMLVAA